MFEFDYNWNGITFLMTYNPAFPESPHWTDVSIESEHGDIPGGGFLMVDNIVLSVQDEIRKLAFEEISHKVGE
jgi:hypothetical protein